MELQQSPMFLSHGGRPTKGNGRKRKGVDEYAAENRVDFTSRSIIRDGQLVRILVCRFCCQSIGARSDRIKEHLASKRHQKLKLEAFREAAEAGRDLTQEYSDDSVSGLLPEPPITMLKFPGKALAHLLEGGGTPEGGRGGREMTPDRECGEKPVMPTPPPLKEHLLSSPPPMPSLGGPGNNNLVRVPGGGCSSPPPAPLHSTHHSSHHHLQQSPQKEPAQQLLCVRWGNFDSNMVSMFTKLRAEEHFVDATLWCEGKTVKVHKMILSACSTYFEKLLTENPNPHPIIFLKDMRFWEITALVEFMYRGEVSIHQEKLQSLLRAAESLQIKGLGSPSANDTPLSGGVDSQVGTGQERDSSGMEEELSNGTLDMSHHSTSSYLSNHLNHTPSLLNMNPMGIDLSNHGSGGVVNPAKRRKKETPRRLDIPRAALPIPVFHSTLNQESMEEEYEGSDEEALTIQENRGPPFQKGDVEEEEEEEESVVREREMQQMEESKSESECEEETQQSYGEETDESGALSLRVASAAERERLERSRKGLNPMKKILVGNLNNNNNEIVPTPLGEND